MKLTLNLSPARDDKETVVAVTDTTLTVNGKSFDLSELPNGATAKHPTLGKVTRNEDDYECTITISHGANAPHETRFPEPILLVNHDGPVPLPPYDAEPDSDDSDDEETAT